MKILIVSGCFYPEVTPRAFRTTELAKQLSRLGHNITILAPIHHDADYAVITRETPLNLVELQRKAKTVPANKNKLLNYGVRTINRLASLLFDYPTSEFYFNVPKAINKSLKGERYDLLISIAMPHSIHWGTNKAIKQNPNLAKVWIADCGDPYMGCKTDTFKKMFYFKYFEKAFCRRCDYITVPIKEAIPSYYPEFHNKIKVIPQGFDFSADWEDNPKSPANEMPTFAFAGSFIPNKRDPRPILEWLSSCNRDFRFHIFTGNRALIAPFVDRLGNKLILHNYIPRNELIPFMKGCDFLLNLENGTAVQSPSKLIDYTLCQRPILSLNSQDMKYTHLEQFLNGDYTNKLESIDLSQYDIRNVASQFLNLYEKALK